MGSDRKSDVIFEIRDPHNPYFDILFDRFLFKMPVVRNRPLRRRRRFFALKYALLSQIKIYVYWASI